MASKTFTVRGHKMRTTSQRRFIVVRVTTDQWAVMDTVVSHAGNTFHQIARDWRGVPMVFDVEADAVATRTGDQVVKVWSSAGAVIEKRSDSLTTARQQASRIGRGCIVIDSTTGEEV